MKKLKLFSLCSSSNDLLTISNEFRNFQQSPKAEPSYSIQPKKDTIGNFSQIEFKHIDFIPSNIPTFIQLYAFSIKKDRKVNLIALQVVNSNNTNNITLIYSHGVNSDLGNVFPFLIDLSIQLKCNVISYDYSGYGRSNGKAKAKTVPSDMTTVMEFCGFDIENSNK